MHVCFAPTAKILRQISSLHNKTIELDQLSAKVRAQQERRSELEARLGRQISQLQRKNREITELNRKITKFTSKFDIGKTFRDCEACPEMVVVPAGGYTMGAMDGAGNERPAHDVRFANHFAAGKFEVTFAQWDACAAAGTCQHKPDDVNWGRENRPVINVSWQDAKAYIAWLNTKADGSPYRLISEAEWEYLARAGANGTACSWGDEVGTDNANCKGCGSRWDSRGTAPVGSFNANAFGLYDMHGNVWEWTEDCWNDNYKRAPGDGTAWTSLGDCKLRVVRGGAWSFTPENLRFTVRRRYVSSNRLASIGFRVARTLPDALISADSE